MAKSFKVTALTIGILFIALVVYWYGFVLKNAAKKVLALQAAQVFTLRACWDMGVRLASEQLRQDETSSPHARLLKGGELSPEESAEIQITRSRASEIDAQCGHDLITTITTYDCLGRTLYDSGPYIIAAYHLRMAMGEAENSLNPQLTGDERSKWTGLWRAEATEFTGPFNHTTDSIGYQGHMPKVDASMTPASWLPYAKKFAQGMVARMIEDPYPLH